MQTTAKFWALGDNRGAGRPNGSGAAIFNPWEHDASLFAI
jgi:hypothetical protein